MFAATGFTPLLVNLESMTSKPKVGGGSKTVSLGKSRRPCIILPPQILLRTREKSRSRWRAASCWTWRNPFTNFIASFWTLSSAWQSRERMGLDACIAVLFLFFCIEFRASIAIHNGGVQADKQFILHVDACLLPPSRQIHRWQGFSLPGVVHKGGQRSDKKHYVGPRHRDNVHRVPAVRRYAHLPPHHPPNPATHRHCAFALF